MFDAAGTENTESLAKYFLSEDKNLNSRVIKMFECGYLMKGLMEGMFPSLLASSAPLLSASSSYGFHFQSESDQDRFPVVFRCLN